MIRGTVLITGVHGLIGQYLFRMIKASATNVVFSGKGPCRLPVENLEYADMDVTDMPRVLEVFEKYRPDFIFHTAALAQPDYCELHQEEAMQVNVIGTKNLLEAAALYKAFFIHLSTDFIFSGNDGPYHEESEPSPVNFYGQTKLLAEKHVRNYSFPWAIVRTALVYGNVLVGTRPNIISWVKEELQNNRQIKVVSDQLRTTTYAGDLTKAIFIIAEKKANGVWHISGKQALSPYEIAMKVADHLHFDGNKIIKVDASSFSQPATRPLRTPLIIDKAKLELGYDPLNFHQGMLAFLHGD